MSQSNIKKGLIALGWMMILLIALFYVGRKEK